MATVEVRLSRTNNQPWGFRLSGGREYAFPLSVVRLTIGGLADQAGLRAGDIIVQVNGEPVSNLVNALALNKITEAGNDLVFNVIRYHPHIEEQPECSLTICV